MNFLKKPVVLIAGLLLATGAAVGYFTVGPGSGDHYSNNYNVTDTNVNHGQYTGGY